MRRTNRKKPRAMCYTSGGAALSLLDAMFIALSCFGNTKSCGDDCAFPPELLRPYIAHARTTSAHQLSTRCACGTYHAYMHRQGGQPRISGWRDLSHATAVAPLAARTPFPKRQVRHPGSGGPADQLVPTFLHTFQQWVQYVLQLQGGTHALGICAQARAGRGRKWFGLLRADMDRLGAATGKP